MKILSQKVPILVFALLVALLISQFFFTRIDGTSNASHTLSSKTIDLIKKTKSPVFVKVFLDGKLTGDFRILEDEIKFMLEDFSQINSNIQYIFVDPNTNEAEKNYLEKEGYFAYNVPLENGFLSTYPYVQLSYKNRSLVIPILIEKSIPIEERALVSVNSLEYKLVDGINKITKDQKPKVGILTHHDELLPINRYSLENALVENYQVAIIDNEILRNNKSFSLYDISSLSQFDALIVAKPTRAFSEKDKIVLDQYLMNGGKMIMSMENVDSEMDSLYKSDRIVAFPRDLNLTDWLFNYNIRMKKAIVKDLQSAPIVLAVGENADNTAFNNFPWPFFPVVFGNKNHNITKDLNPVKFEFANPIELVNNQLGLQSTVLLQSSQRTALHPPLGFITFSSIEDTDPEYYQSGSQILAVLVEGDFTSAYSERAERKEITNFISKSSKAKLLVIGDGDFMKNHVVNGNPIPLGADKYYLRPDGNKAPSVMYANEEFILNSLDYMLDTEQLMGLKNKNNQINLLDGIKVKEEKLKWQLVAVLAPVLLVVAFGLLFFFGFRRFIV